MERLMKREVEKAGFGMYVEFFDKFGRWYRIFAITVIGVYTGISYTVCVLCVIIFQISIS